MSVVGFDLGNESGIVAVAHQSGLYVVLNDESKCETPSLVFFGDKQRSIGTAATSSITTNPKNVVSQIKRLIGRKFADPDVQSDLQYLPFRVTEGPDCFPLIHVRYLGEEKVFTPTQILAMVLSHLKTIAEKNLNDVVDNCCIGIPIYFTYLQRSAVLDAATIAGLHPLRLLHDTTATALAYGIYKSDLPENDQLNVAFVDVGHASMQVGIVGFRKRELKILSHSYGSSLGGRDFDEVLFKYFADKFKEEYKINVYQNERACIRLRTACEKLKKVLSTNPEAPLNIDCLMDDKDVRGFIKREEFEKLSAPILERVKGPLDKALAEAGLTVDNMHFVEVVGSGSQVPAIIKILREFFGKEPRRTMNTSEYVARGCAWQCAMLSPTFEVCEYQVNDSFPFSIALSWKDENGVEATTVVFPKGNPLPSLKVLTFCKASTFSVDAVYIDHPKKIISTYTIGPFQTSKGAKAKVELKVLLNIHGMISVDSATVESQKKAKKTNVRVQEMVYGLLPAKRLHKMCNEEYEMALQDRIMEETKDKNNSLESHYKDTKGQQKEAEEKFVVEKEKLVGQIEELKGKLIPLKEELIETKQHNASLQAEIGSNRQSAAISAAQAHQDVIEVLERNAHLEGEKIMLEKELVTKASRLEREVVRLQSNLVKLEAATKAAEEEANKMKSEAEEKFVVEKEKLVGQIEALKGKLIALKEELIETKKHNSPLQAEIGNNRQSAAISAAQVHQDEIEVLERYAHLEGEKIVLEKELEELVTKVSRLKGEVVRLQSNLVTSEAATKATEEEANKLKSEAEEKFVVEKEKLVGQIEALKGKLTALKEELIETKQHNASLQAEIRNNRQSANLSAAQVHQDVIEVLARNAHLEGGKIVLEKELEELVTKASRLEGEVARLQSNLVTSEAATEAAEEEANRLKSEIDSLNKALEESKRQWKEFVGEKEKLVGQVETLKQHNGFLQVDIGNHHQSVAVFAAHTHQDMSELMERISHLEAEILKTGKEEESVVPNWVRNAVAASTGVVAAAVFISLYLRLRKHES